MVLGAVVERRLALRVSLRVPARVIVGLRPIAATLLDLSITGCRLLASQPIVATGSAWVLLPAGLGGRWLRPLHAELAWAESVLGQPTGVCEVGALFHDLLPGQTQRLIRAVSQILADPRTATRRREPRLPFERRVIARTREQPRILVGQGLSLSGIRVHGAEEFEVGARLQLAIHGGGARPPLVLTASVLRKDSADGAALHFHDLGEAERLYLAELLEELPPLVGANGAPAVVAELVCERADERA